MCAEIFLIFFLFIHSRLTDNVCRFSALLLQLGAARSHAPLQLHYCSFKCFAPAHFQQTEHLLFRCRNSTHFSNLVTIHNLYLKRHYSCFSFFFFFFTVLRCGLLIWLKGPARCRKWLKKKKNFHTFRARARANL